jgi:hypothetical protein
LIEKFRVFPDSTAEILSRGKSKVPLKSVAHRRPPMRKSIPWQQILSGSVVNDGPFGTEYQVAGLGHVFVTEYDRAQAKHVNSDVSGALCNLITIEEPRPDSSWTIVGFQRR